MTQSASELLLTTNEMSINACQCTEAAKHDFTARSWQERYWGKDRDNCHAPRKISVYTFYRQNIGRDDVHINVFYINLPMIFLLDCSWTPCFIKTLVIIYKFKPFTHSANFIAASIKIVMTSGIYDIFHMGN